MKKINAKKSDEENKNKLCLCVVIIYTDTVKINGKDVANGRDR